MPQAVPRNVETYVTRDGKDVFQGWLTGLADRRAKLLIEKTVAKVRLGNLGQHKSVGEGVQEIVLDYGPGYRIYFARPSGPIVLLLLGGDKASQRADIRRAQAYWADYLEAINRGTPK